jgi:hypothetical protein
MNNYRSGDSSLRIYLNKVNNFIYETLKRGTLKLTMLTKSRGDIHNTRLYKDNWLNNYGQLLILLITLSLFNINIKYPYKISPRGETIIKCRQVNSLISQNNNLISQNKVIIGRRYMSSLSKTEIKDPNNSLEILNKLESTY